MAELADKMDVSVKTVHRKITAVFVEKNETSEAQNHIRLAPHLSRYTSSVLIMDATFFGKKGSKSQWGILVAIDGITGDILVSKYILQETKEDYNILLQALLNAKYPTPLFAVIDGRKGVKESVQTYYPHTPVQVCQAHKIATIDRYLLKNPIINTSNKIESIFSHLKQKVRIHRGIQPKKRLQLALSLLWKDDSPT